MRNPIAIRWQFCALALWLLSSWCGECFYHPEVRHAIVPAAKVDPSHFSTKYGDDKGDSLYYGYRFYNASTGRWLSRDPIDENGAKAIRGDTKSHESTGDGNPCLFVGNDPIRRIDPYGLTLADVWTKYHTGHLRKMVGVDVTGAAVVGLGGAQAWSVQAGFFADTCEVAFYFIGPAVIETSKDPNRPAWKKLFVDMPVGLDISMSGNASVAMYRGPGNASARTWEGLFYGGQVGGGPLGKLGIGAFWDPNGYWIGGSVGAGASLTPVSARTNPQVYWMIGKPKVLPKCACYAVISQMP
jgi:RHS repeat-associated protein